MNYSKPKSIIKRRKAEKALFFDGKWSNNGTITEYTKVSSALQPVWSSAVKIDIRKELTQALMLGGGHDTQAGSGSQSRQCAEGADAHTGPQPR